MKTINLAFGGSSLILGIGMIAFALQRGGVAPTLGVVFGLLLLVNATFRLWLARNSG